MADYNSKYSGEQVEALLDQVASGNAGGGGGGGIAVETDPIFSASPAATITEQKMAEWDAKSEKGEKGDKGDKGDTGVGVQSVTQTTTSSADGGSNVVTVTLTDGTKSTFTVKNGSKGSQGIQGEQGPKGNTGDTGATGAQGPKGDKGDKGDTGAAGTNGTNGKDGADGATFTPSVDSAGNLSWSNNKGLTNPPTVNIKGPKGDAGSGGGSTGGKEVIVYNGWDVQINDALPNKIYILTNFEVWTFEIISFSDETAYDEYTFIFPYPAEGLSLPSDVVFANEVVPNVGADTLCELSIVGITSGSQRRYNAVLTTFGYL